MHTTIVPSGAVRGHRATKGRRHDVRRTTSRCDWSIVGLWGVPTCCDACWKSMLLGVLPCRGSVAGARVNVMRIVSCCRRAMPCREVCYKQVFQPMSRERHRCCERVICHHRRCCKPCRQTLDVARPVKLTLLQCKAQLFLCCNSNWTNNAAMQIEVTCCNASQL